MIQDEDTGIWVPAYPLVVITIMRQNGKTTILLAWSAHRLVMWEAWDGKPQAVTYTAQTGMDAVQKFRDDWIPAWRDSPFNAAIDGKPRLSAGTGIGWDIKGGASLRVLNNSPSAGHGKVVDLPLMDEIFADQDSAREQAMIPATATRHDSQTVMASTAGDETSVLLAQKQAAGRQAVREDRREGIAYFEWSGDPKADPEDPETWWSEMPALGYTIGERTVRNALSSAKTNPDEGIDEFNRAWRNIPKGGAVGEVLPADMWRRVSVRRCSPTTGPVVAIAATKDRSRASVVLADREGRAKLVANDRVVTDDESPDWILDELGDRPNNCAVVVRSGRAPLAFLVTELRRAGMTVLEYSPDDYVQACGHFWQGLGLEAFAVESHPNFDAAVQGARRKPTGDAWVWSLDVTADCSPLEAVTLALHAAYQSLDPLDNIW
jgi:hypothetical protein